MEKRPLHLLRTLLIACILLTACAQIPSPAEREDVASRLASHAGWMPQDIAAGAFTLRAYLPATVAHAQTLTIYIEGDGLAWIDSSTPSFDPTPANPMALKLALRDPEPAAYLSRPCQFVGAGNQPNCQQKYWTSHRFSEELVHASNLAIEQLKNRLGAKSLILVGYSGGGAIAALVAARRTDVARLMTVAGNLDHRTWSQQARLSPLAGSLNPAEQWQALQHIPQTHFVGGKDNVIGEYVARAYASNFPPAARPQIISLPEFDHRCCWAEQWPALKNAGLSSRPSGP